MSKKKSNIIKGMIFFLIVGLFYNFIWKEYIVNPTASDVLAKENGDRVVLTEIDNRQSVGILKLSDGYHVYALSKGFWGWSRTDDFYLQDESMDENFVASKESFEFKGNKEVDIVLVMTQDEDISYFKAYDENENEIYFDTIRDENGKELHYTFSESPLIGKITYEAYSIDDELLYREEKRVM